MMTIALIKMMKLSMSDTKIKLRQDCNVISDNEINDDVDCNVNFDNENEKDDDDSNDNTKTRL